MSLSSLSNRVCIHGSLWTSRWEVVRFVWAKCWYFGILFALQSWRLFHKESIVECFVSRTSFGRNARAGREALFERLKI
jgi:hypothetical protein